MDNNDDQEYLNRAKKAAQEETKKSLKTGDDFDIAKTILKDFYKETNDDSAAITKSLKTLTTVLKNVIANPMEPKYRSLDTTKKPVQEKLLNYTSLVNFLTMCGFEEKGSEMVLKGYPGEKLNNALDCIYAELKANADKFGVKVQSSFNPYQEGITSTTGSKLPSAGAETSQYNPSYLDKMFEEERKLKRKLMGRKVEDREVTVFNTQSGGGDFKAVMQAYDEENRKEEEEYEEELRRATALKFLGENSKNQKFGNKRLQELQKYQKQKVYSTTIIRIKFPDGLILQGKFGARERLEKVYEFVEENLYDKDREFYLYKAPPKKILTNKKEILQKLDLVPSGMLFFQWTDEDLATSSSSIVLDMKKLKEKVKVF